MTLKGKQKSYLRSMAMTMDAIFQIGKEGIGDHFVKQLDDALEARELIKIKILRRRPKKRENRWQRNLTRSWCRSLAVALCYIANQGKNQKLNCLFDSG